MSLASSATDLPLCETPDDPAPPRGRAGFLRTVDGVKLRYAHWPADPGVPSRGTVTILSGRTEFIEKYYEVVRDLTARGFAAAIFDWRGQGGSERLLRHPLKGHVGSFQDYQADLAAFVRQVLFPDCPAPHFVLAHSMGAVVALDSVLQGHRWFDRMVLLAPMLALNLGAGTGAARVLSRTLRGPFGWAFIPGGTHRAITERPFATNPVTSDARRYELAAAMVRAHPGLGLGAPTISWLAAAFDIMDKLADPEAVRRIRQPLLLVGAGRDRIVSARAVEHLSARLIAGGHVIIPGSRHEILMEVDPIRAQFWAAFDAFIPGAETLIPSG
ncbi:MAG: alpha/beta hydrolase [Rhizobiales bacterium]|nr:alpha/beta hydrolase [Hyphomicrobiales bacterium]